MSFTSYLDATGLANARAYATMGACCVEQGFNVAFFIADWDNYFNTMWVLEWVLDKTLDSESFGIIVVVLSTVISHEYRNKAHRVASI